MLRKFLQDVFLVLGVLAILSPVAILASDNYYTTHAVVDEKIKLAVGNITNTIDGYRLQDVNDAIWELETKIANGEAQKSDRPKLERYKRQREEMLKKAN